MSSTSSVSKAIEYIQNKIDKKIWQKGKQLPSTRELALQIHVDIHALSVALKALSQNKTLTVIPRKGTFVGTTPIKVENDLAAHRSTSGRKKWQRIRVQIEHDILNGLFLNRSGKSELPSPTILCQRYGVCYQTMSKVCEALAADGIIFRSRNSYQISSPVHLSPTSTILSISSSSQTNPSVYNDFIRYGLTSLELLCSRNNILLTKSGTAIFNNPKGKINHLNLKKDSHFGYILWSNGIEINLVEKIVSELSKLKKPVAIIDEENNPAIPDLIRSFPFCKIFAIASVSAGKQVGRYLLKKGHRNCAYISCYNDHAWSHSRLAGLSDAFANAGFKHGVTAFMDESFDKKDPHYVDSVYMAKVSKEIEEHFPAALWWHLPRAMTNLTDLENLEYSYAKVLAGNLFPKALTDSTITAWVCANDFIALSALHFLRETQTSDTARRIAIIGFDDVAVATEDDITSYNFAPSLLVENALGFIINPQQEFLRNRSLIEVDGLLIERGSSREGLKVKPVS